jgi:hypothetical protein
LLNFTRRCFAVLTGVSFAAIFVACGGSSARVASPTIAIDPSIEHGVDILRPDLRFNVVFRAQDSIFPEDLQGYELVWRQWDSTSRWDRLYPGGGEFTVISGITAGMPSAAVSCIWSTNKQPKGMAYTTCGLGASGTGDKLDFILSVASVQVARPGPVTLGRDTICYELWFVSAAGLCVDAADSTPLSLTYRSATGDLFVLEAVEILPPVELRVPSDMTWAAARDADVSVAVLDLPAGATGD